MVACTSCGSGKVRTGLDFGLQPVSSHFYKGDGRDIAKQGLVVGQCTGCGLVQLCAPFDFEIISPPHEWIVYKEPEAHLDDMVDALFREVGLDEKSRILGLSYKDESTLARLDRKGVGYTRTLDVVKDLGATQDHPNIESVPGLLTDEFVRNFTKANGTYDVVVARHVFEHAENVRSLFSSAKKLLSDDGVLVIEVPDCESNLALKDVTMLWEEHAAYFTMKSLEESAANNCFHKIFSNPYEYHFEDCMVLFACKESAATVQAGAGGDLPVDRSSEFRAFDVYCDAVHSAQIALQEYCRKQVSENKKIAIYGAGHLGCNFVNLLGLGDYVSFFCDDFPEKQGYYMPGSHLLVKSSSAIMDEGIDICLMSLPISIEEKIYKNNQPFIDAGGLFYSIFRESPSSIYNHLDES